MLTKEQDYERVEDWPPARSFREVSEEKVKSTNTAPPFTKFFKT